LFLFCEFDAGKVNGAWTEDVLASASCLFGVLEVILLQLVQFFVEILAVCFRFTLEIAVNALLDEFQNLGHVAAPSKCLLYNCSFSLIFFRYKNLIS